MIELLISTYLIIGCIASLVVLFTVFQEDYDEFVREYFDETPPTTTEKWFVILITLFIWPYSLYMGFRND